MDAASASRLGFRVIYDGLGPVYWDRDPGQFGIQDASGALYPGDLDADGCISFAFSLAVKPGRADAPVFSGPFAHGPPAKRFLYLGWRNRNAAFAQRVSLPLTSIGWEQVRQAQALGAALVCRLVDKHPRATTTGANIGGTRPVVWRVGSADDRA
jgi:hypothetical protein